MHRRAFALLAAFAISAPVVAQQGRQASSGQRGPVAAMFSDDQKRHASLTLSFLPADLSATKAAASPARVYLTAGDLVRAFDRPVFRPDAAIVPTNTDLNVTSSSPTIQRVLIERVQKQADVMRDLEDQIAARRRQQPSSGGERGLLRIGEDFFVAELPRHADGRPAGGAFPKAACLVATEFPGGGAIDRRELFVQDRVRKGIAGCLAALDAAGAHSVIVPLMGASSSSTQANDAQFEGQRVLKECRLINSTAGIALGIHDFAADRRSVREIGVVQWDQEILEMFEAPKSSRIAQNAYRAYAEQIRQAFRKGLAGQNTSAGDVNGSCSAIFNVQ